MIRELQEVIGIEGAIDNAVVQGDASLQTVADMVVPYRDGALGWFAAYEAWVRGETGVPPNDPVFPTVDEALATMAANDPDGRERAQRLFVLTVLSRALPEYGPNGDFADLVQAALAPLTPSQDVIDARTLHLLITDEDHIFSTIEDWAEMLEKAESVGVLDHTTAMQSVPPCSATWRVVQVGGVPVDAAELTATDFFPGLKVADIEDFLDPSHWPTCHPFWCSMTPVNPPVPNHRLFIEVVSLNCAAGAALQMTTVLEFVTVRTPASATAGERVDIQYWLWNGEPHGDGRIVVDEGFIAAWDTTGGLTMHTLKLVAFGPGFPGAYLAMIMCPLGYATQGEQMVYTCAVPHSMGSTSSAASAATSAAPAVEGGPLVVDHTNDLGLLHKLARHRGPRLTMVRSPEKGGLGVVKPSGPGAASAQASTAAGGDAGDTMASMVTSTAETVIGCAQDAATAYASSYEKMMGGTYTPNDAVKDGVSWWSRMVRDVGLVAAAARRGGRRPPTPGPTPDPGDPGRGGVTE